MLFKFYDLNFSHRFKFFQLCKKYFRSDITLLYNYMLSDSLNSGLIKIKYTQITWSKIAYRNLIIIYTYINFLHFIESLERKKVYWCFNSEKGTKSFFLPVILVRMGENFSAGENVILASDVLERRKYLEGEGLLSYETF